MKSLAVLILAICFPEFPTQQLPSYNSFRSSSGSSRFVPNPVPRSNQLPVTFSTGPTILTNSVPLPQYQSNRNIPVISPVASGFLPQNFGIHPTSNVKRIMMTPLNNGILSRTEPLQPQPLGVPVVQSQPVIVPVVQSQPVLAPVATPEQVQIRTSFQQAGPEAEQETLNVPQMTAEDKLQASVEVPDVAGVPAGGLLGGALLGGSGNDLLGFARDFLVGYVSGIGRICQQVTPQTPGPSQCHCSKTNQDASSEELGLNDELNADLARKLWQCFPDACTCQDGMEVPTPELDFDISFLDDSIVENVITAVFSS